MEIPVYLRKSGDEKVKLHALVEIDQEPGSRLELQSTTYLSVDSQSHYYLKRKSSNDSAELWLIELHCRDHSQEPYTYTGVLSRKYRDVPDDWIEDV